MKYFALLPPILPIRKIMANVPIRTMIVSCQQVTIIPINVAMIVIAEDTICGKL